MDNNNQNAYFESNWNRLDAFIVFISLCSLLFPGLTFLRSLRAIRPLRIAARNPNVKIILSTLFSAIVPAIHSILFSFFFMTIMAIVGLQMFNGLFNYCTEQQNLEPTKTGDVPLTPLRWELGKEDCLEAGHRWHTFQHNFDNMAGNPPVRSQLAILAAAITCAFPAPFSPPS